MERDDIIRMAREAGWPSMAVDNLPGTQDMSRLERFAALVAAHEREAAAKDCESLLPRKRIFDPRYFEAVGDCVATIRARGEA